MKLPAFLLSALMIAPLPAFAEHRRVYEESYCYRNTEQYVPQNTHQTDDNSCIEGSVLGGIAGGGLGAALSRGDGRWWAIPLGIVGGSMVGCQIDGG